MALELQELVHGFKSAQQFISYICSFERRNCWFGQDIFGGTLCRNVWVSTGLLYGFPETWQVVINIGTTIITFQMVFLIQNTQNSNAKAIHLKLDELIRALRRARNNLVDLEDLSD
jgi:low affinity iron permease